MSLFILFYITWFDFIIHNSVLYVFIPDVFYFKEKISLQNT